MEFAYEVEDRSPCQRYNIKVRNSNGANDVIEKEENAWKRKKIRMLKGVNKKRMVAKEKRKEG